MTFVGEKLLFPKSCVVAIKDKREGSTSREELGTSWIVTVCVDGITAASWRVIKDKIKLA